MIDDISLLSIVSPNFLNSSFTLGVVRITELTLCLKYLLKQQYVTWYSIIAIWLKTTNSEIHYDTISSGYCFFNVTVLVTDPRYLLLEFALWFGSIEKLFSKWMSLRLCDDPRLFVSGKLTKFSSISTVHWKTDFRCCADRKWSTNATFYVVTLYGCQLSCCHWKWSYTNSINCHCKNISMSRYCNRSYLITIY